MGGAAAPYIWPAIGMLGSSTIGALTAPDAQELQSFEGEEGLDPRDMLRTSSAGISDMISLLKSRANRPVTLRSSYVQQPPVFAGGGLPMPIGLTGVDPALNDPSLLTLPGLSGVNQGDVVDRTFPPRGSGENPRDGGPGGTGPDGELIIGDDDAVESGPMGMRMGTSQPTMPARRNAFGASTSRPSYSTNVSEHDDLEQGMGAVELLLRSMAGAGARR